MRVTRAALTAAALLFATNAVAGSSDPVAAEALFKEGRAAFDRGDYALACMKFEASLKLDNAPGTLLNLGACSEKLGRVGSAWQAYEEALEHLVPNDPRTAFAKERAAALEPRVPLLTLRLAPHAAGAVVRRDGIAIEPGALGVPLPTNPGPHTVVVVESGHEPRSFSVTLGERDRAALDVDVGPAIEQQRPARTAGLVVGGVGVLTLAAGAIAGIVASDDKSTMLANCDASFACSQRGLDAASAGKTSSTVSTIGFIGGGALVAAGVALFVVGSRTSRSNAAWIAPSLAPTRASLAIGGSF